MPKSRSRGQSAEQIDSGVGSAKTGAETEANSETETFEQFQARKVIAQPAEPEESSSEDSQSDRLAGPEHTLESFLEEMFPSDQGGELLPNGMPRVDWLKKHFRTKSAAIRYLSGKGHKNSEIAKHLGISYQHVRNVLTTTLKRGPNELPVIPPTSSD